MNAYIVTAEPSSIPPAASAPTEVTPAAATSNELTPGASSAAATPAEATTGFHQLGLGEAVLRAIADAGYHTPTPIQAKAIPEVLGGRDLLGIAQTGTGKTASFTLPMIDILGKGRARMRMPRSLILEPTRELAQQVAVNFDTYGKHHKLSMALLIGGESMDEQMRKLDRGVDVLIATPGRLIDLFERGKILLNDIKIFVIDEADRMLDMGFIPDIEKIASLLPRARQTMLFSATMPPEIRRLAQRFMQTPIEVSVAPPSTPAANVSQHLVIVRQEDKRHALRSILRQEEVANAFIFCNRKRDVYILFKSLERHGFKAGQLHGDMVQSKRTETMDAFKRGEFPLLVCSDVAARGLDVQGLSHVFNFDIPFNPEDYVHRIGRTGRAGRSGVAYSFADPEEMKCVEAIEGLIKKPLPRLTVTGVDVPDVNAELESEAEDRLERHGQGGGRRGGGRQGGGRRGGAPVTGSRHGRHMPKMKSPVPHGGRRPEPISQADSMGVADDRGGNPTPRYNSGRQPTLPDDTPTPVGFGNDLPAFLKRGS